MAAELPIELKSGERARLIPVIADTSKEGRATSILMAALCHVRPLAIEIFGGIGQRVGVRTRVDVFTEVVFKQSQGKLPIRPDGFISLSSGNKSWTCLLEAKIGRNTIDQEQIAQYAELARQNRIDAILTVSNQFVVLPTHLPYHIDKSFRKHVSFFHFSWLSFLTKAMLTLENGEFSSSHERTILSETIRFFRHESAGISSFTQMNSEWRDLVTRVQSGAPLNPQSDEILNSVASWHQEQRDLCLILTRRLQRSVQLRISKAHRDDPVLRHRDDSSHLAKTFKLECIFDVPDAAASMSVVVDLRRKSVICSMRLEAPKDRQKSTARTNWLLRQLKDTKPENVFIRSIWPRRLPDIQHALAEVREDPAILDHQHTDESISAFEVIQVADLGGKFSSPRKFIELLEDFVPGYYENITQKLNAWVPPPPKLHRKDPADESGLGDDSTTPSPSVKSAHHESQNNQGAVETSNAPPDTIEAEGAKDNDNFWVNPVSATESSDNGS